MDTGGSVHRYCRLKRCRTVVEFGEPAAPDQWESVREWRKRARQGLLANRMQLNSPARHDRGELARKRLQTNVDLSPYHMLGIYWPIKREIDIREVALQHVAGGGELALPVVVTRSQPLEFWRWLPGMSLGRGLWDIPIPRERNPVVPQAFIIPLLGFDAEGYRLGYGSGYYDRTLAAAAAHPFCVGLGYDSAYLPSIYPQQHDIPMDVIVTDLRLMRRETGSKRMAVAAT